MARKARIVPNGKPNQFEVEWGSLEKWVAGILASLLVVSVIGVIRMNWTLAVTKQALDDHLKRPDIHQSVAAKREIAQEEIEHHEARAH